MLTTQWWELRKVGISGGRLAKIEEGMGEAIVWTFSRLGIDGRVE